MNVCIIGLGYVGLTLALTMANCGLTVFGVDSKKQTVNSLKKGISTISEKDTEKILGNTLNKQFFVYDEIPDEKIDAFIISVGTPLNLDKTPILEYIINSSTAVGGKLQKGQIVILRSTIPVGTTKKTVIPILEKESNLKNEVDFDVVFAPERTAEGVALSELRTNPQIIGGTKKGIEKCEKIFRQMTPTIVPVSNIESAEMIKLIDNTYRDVHFAYANEIAIICEMLKIDARECIEKANFSYSRNKIPIPSPGVGGPCLSKDPHILSYVTKEFHYEPNLIIHSRRINEFVPSFLAKKIIRKLNSVKKIENIKIFIMGFAFKGDPETGDMRNSSTLILVEELKKKFGNLFGYDPVVNKIEMEEIGINCVSIEDGFTNADCVIIMNNHKSYQDLDIKKLIKKSAKPCLFVDCWSMFPDMVNEDQINYTGVGLD